MATDSCGVVETTIEIGGEGYISILAMSYMNKCD